jgi:hypothetical protein
MISFKEFLVESAHDLTSKDNKQKVRESFIKMAGLDPAKVAKHFGPVTASNFKNKYDAFYDEFPTAAKSLASYGKADGMGPGEALCYFLFDNITLGGKNAPIDLYADGKPFAEVKGGRKGPGPNVISNFKLSKDSSKAVVELFKDLKKFNDKYADITGDDLPSWDTPATSTTSAINSWRSIDLEVLAKESTGGGKKPIDLVLKKDGDLTIKGDSDPLLNVKKSKSIKPVSDLISDNAQVTLTPEDKKISTIEKIIARWADAITNEYLKDKLVALIESETGKLMFFGQVDADQIDLLTCHRNQPWAKVFVSGTRQDAPVPQVAKKVEKKSKSKAEDLGKQLSKKK